MRNIPKQHLKNGIFVGTSMLNGPSKCEQGTITPEAKLQANTFSKKMACGRASTLTGLVDNESWFSLGWFTTCMSIANVTVQATCLLT